MPRQRLGEMLQARGLTTAERLEHALKTRNETGTRLGDVLSSEGAVHPLQLHETLAEQHGLPFVRLTDSPPDPDLMEADHLHDYIARRAVPWKREGGALVIATCEPTDDLLGWAEAAYGIPCKLAATSPYDIRHAVETRFGSCLTRESRLHLYHAAPDLSARVTFTGEQRIIFGLLALAAVFTFLRYPYTALGWAAVALHVLYASTMIFKLLVFRVGAASRPAEVPPLPDNADLPVYTILLPLYDEPESLPHLMASLKRLDYPAAKLDIKLLLEQDDHATWQAARAEKLPWNVDIIRVPPSLPRTKPKALNYGLRFARGEFVTIYDAEDEPAPDQLKKAVAAFRAGPPDLACLQGRLHYYNARDNWLTRWFALEYAILFDILLPGLQKLRLPIPLGGTSNHLALARLKELGAWDPFNVTEDADLGVRIAGMGLKTAMLDSVTLEEAPLKTRAWMRQRSRWVKGYMQTWLVHTRKPLDLWRNVGTASFFGLHYFIGFAPLTFLTAPLVWLFWGISLALPESRLEALGLPGWFGPLAWANLLLHFGVHWAQAFHAAPSLRNYKENEGNYLLAAATYPLYWLLHSLAAYKALAQLLYKPHYWEKTAHGLAHRPQASG